MKIRLLKKARQKVKIYKRNNMYYVQVSGYLLMKRKTKNEAFATYRYWIKEEALTIFGFRPKQRIR